MFTYHHEFYLLYDDSSAVIISYSNDAGYEQVAYMYGTYSYTKQPDNTGVVSLTDNNGRATSFSIPFTDFGASRGPFDNRFAVYRMGSPYNQSTRMTLSTGTNAIAGFVLSKPAIVLSRATSFSLQQFNVVNVAKAGPFDTFNSNGDNISKPYNVQFGTLNANVAQNVFSKFGAFQLSPNSGEGFSLQMFGIGAYTNVFTNTGSLGDALLELYVIPLEDF